MKIPLTFKMPDVIDSAIENARENLAVISESDEDDIRETCRKFVEHGEYVVIEIDSKAKTATVLKVRR